MLAALPEKALAPTQLAPRLRALAKTRGIAELERFGGAWRDASLAAAERAGILDRPAATIRGHLDRF